MLLWRLPNHVNWTAAGEQQLKPYLRDGDGCPCSPCYMGGADDGRSPGESVGHGALRAYSVACTAVSVCLAAGRLDSFFKPVPQSDKPAPKRKAPEPKPKGKASTSKKVKAGAFGGKR